MDRVRVRLTERQMSALRRVSAATGRSIAELIREGVEKVLARQARRASAVAGKFASRRADVSADHDTHVAEAFGG